MRRSDVPTPALFIDIPTSHCDPTVDLCGAFRIMRGDEVIDIWPIKARLLRETRR